jgi:BirA family biotin operon repressor/biotin-[acetyl-CoA-carboxylase] ligase
MRALSPRSAVAPLDRRLVIASLTASTRSALAGLQVLERVDSTNARLLRRDDLPTDRPTACLAEEQTAGRGRRGRPWISPPGGSLYMSLGIGLTPGERVAGTLSLELGIAVVETLNRLGAEGVGLKWPNDLYAAGAKLGGILVETRRRGGTGGVLVAGLGLNLCRHTAYGEGIDQSWTDLAAVAPSGLPERNGLAAALVDAMWTGLKRRGAIVSTGLAERFAALDVLSGRDVVLDTPSGRFTGSSQGIGSNGALRVGIDGGVREFTAAEVSVRPVR